jgi:predicted TIM-barrel fold metal-dependent hydrolase
MNDWLLGLPSVSIDHLGLSLEALPCLLALAERGVRVKASGFGRVDFDVRHALRELWSANPDCLMFGTDLPSTRARRAFADSDVDLVLDSFDGAAAAKIMFGNAAAFYRLDPNGSKHLP